GRDRYGPDDQPLYCRNTWRTAMGRAENDGRSHHEFHTACRSGNGMKRPENLVFVVEDDASMRTALKNLLRSVGLEAHLFATADEFLKYDRPNLPSCLILDVRLPGLSGLDLQRELSAKHIHIPIIFITAHGDIPMSVRAMKAGAVEFLTKPFR